MADKQNSFGGRPGPEEVKQMRRDYPSGWLELSMYESIALMIDALIDAPPGYSFSNPELAGRAGISAESVRNHIGTLEELGIVKGIDDKSKRQVNDESRVLREIFGLNDAVNAVRSGASASVTHLSTRLSEDELESRIPDGEDDERGDEQVPGTKDINPNTAPSFS